jgi:hypothetical protein
VHDRYTLGTLEWLSNLFLAQLSSFFNVIVLIPSTSRQRLDLFVEFVSQLDRFTNLLLQALLNRFLVPDRNLNTILTEVFF